jgi:hypothetical protein
MKRLILAGLALLAVHVAQAQTLSGGPGYVQQALVFKGGPLATLNAGTGNNTLTNGTYSTPVALTGGSGTGATATFVVTGCAGACSVAATIVNAGGVIGTTGAQGYYLTDSVTVPGSTFAGSGSVTFTVATVSPFLWVSPVSLAHVDACSSGQSGSGGQNSATGGAGAGGAGGMCAPNFDLYIVPGSTLTITPGQPQAGRA